jgi:chitin disaccharide deacetylase
MRDATARQLVVNADDLGYDPEIDRGILEAHRLGIVTSATLMVGTPFARDALAAVPPSLAVGLHAVFPPGLDETEIERALLEQLRRFEDLRGRPPSHLDSHKHVHAQPGALAAFGRVAARRRLPVRALDERMRQALRAVGVRTADHFLGRADKYPCWTVEKLRETLRSLPDGVTEIMCHPGHTPSHALTSFGKEREEELLAVCDPGSRAILSDREIALVAYDRLPASRLPGG